MAPDDDIEQRFEIAVRLALGASRRPASPECLTPEVIAAYYVYALNRIERSRCEAHISECARCRETLDALIHAKPEDELSPESAARVAEAELVQPGSAPPRRLKPATPPAPERSRVWRVAGPAIAFAVVAAAVILADFQVRQSIDTGEAARVAAVQARARRHVSHRTPTTSAARGENELALNEVRPEPAARAARVETGAPNAVGPASGAARPAPKRVYSNPLFQGAPPARATRPSRSRIAVEASARAKAQPPKGEPQLAASAADDTRTPANSTTESVTASAAPGIAALSVKPPTNAEPIGTSTDGTRFGTTPPANAVAAQAVKAHPVATASPAVSVKSSESKPATAPAAHAALASKMASAPKTALARNSPVARASLPAVAPVTAPTSIAPQAGKPRSLAALPVATTAPGAKVISAAKAASGTKTVAAAPSRAAAPAHAAKTQTTRRTGEESHATKLASKRIEKPAHSGQKRQTKLVTSTRVHRAAHMLGAKHTRAVVAHAPSTAAPEVARLAPDRQAAIGTPRTDLVIASASGPASIVPAVAPVASGIPLPPRSALIAPADGSVYWSFQDFGIIYRSTDRKSWVRLASGTQDDLLAGAAPSRTVCWAVGRHGAIVLTTDGSHWTAIKSPTTADLVGVMAASADVATVVTRDGQRFSTFDGGSNWQPGGGETDAWQH